MASDIYLSYESATNGVRQVLDSVTDSSKNYSSFYYYQPLLPLLHLMVKLSLPTTTYFSTAVLTNANTDINTISIYYLLSVLLCVISQ